jgi:serine/threonine-protein kinase RsbW
MDVRLTFVIPSHPRFLALVRATVAELGATYGLSEPECCNVTLAVDEALANIIRHAYHGDPDQPIELTCTASAAAFEFTMVDRGQPFDPGRIKTRPPDEHALGGRGIHLIRMIMDEAIYDRIAAGNRLRLRKRIPTGAVDATNQGSDV